MIQVRFWGGPKDGEIIYTNALPQNELLCMDGSVDTIFDVLNLTGVLNNPVRTQIYHKYILSETERPGLYYYKYDGVI